MTARFAGAHLNPLLAWPDIAGLGVLAGIGFTVSLLFAELSNDAHLTQAKGAILLSSAAASLLAALILGRRRKGSSVESRVRGCSGAPPKCADQGLHPDSEDPFP